jgi:hypothetical protein
MEAWQTAEETTLKTVVGQPTVSSNLTPSATVYRQTTAYEKRAGLYGHLSPRPSILGIYSRIVHDSPGLSALEIGAQLGSEGPSRLLRPTIATATTGPAVTSMLLINQRHKASRRRAGSNSEDLGRAAMHAARQATPGAVAFAAKEATGKACGVPVARSQGHSWAIG